MGQPIPGMVETMRSMSLMPMNGAMTPPSAVDQQVAAQQPTRAEAARNLHAAQGERDQRDDDQRVEDHRRQDRRLRRGAEPMMLSLSSAGIGRDEHRRDDREVLRDVVGDRERRQRAAGDEQLLADLDDVDELGRVGVEVDHVAGLLGGRRARCSSPRRRRPRRGPGRRWCRRRSSRRAGRPPAPCGCRPSCPRAWPRRGSRRRRPRPRSPAAVSGLSPVIITVRMPIARSSANRSVMPSLTTSLRWIDAEHLRAARARPCGRPPAACRPRGRSPSTTACSSTGSLPTPTTQAAIGRAGTLADAPSRRPGRRRTCGSGR